MTRETAPDVPRSPRHGWRNIGILVACAFLLALLHHQVATSPASVAPIRPGGDAPQVLVPEASEPSGGPLTPADPVGSPPTTMGCNDLRATLAERVEALAPACEATIAASGCEPAVPFPDLVRGPEAVRTAMEDLFSECDPRIGDVVHVACEEYPCRFGVRDGAFEDVPDCPPLHRFRASYEAGVHPAGPGLATDGWTYFPIERYEGTQLQGPVEARAAIVVRHALESQRLAAAAGAGGPGRALAARPACAEVERTAAALSGPSACEELLTHWGCAPTPPDPARLAAVEHHVERAHALLEALEDDCPSFPAATARLDCTAVPCLLAFEPRPGELWNASVCDTPGLTYEFRMAYARQSDGPTTDVVVIPIYDASDWDELDLAVAWLEDGSYRTWRMGQRYVR